MKKPVILIIAIIYIIAIAVVGFLGISARVFNPKVFVESIQLNFSSNESTFTSLPINEIEKKDYFLDYKYKIETSATQVKFRVSASVLPIDATDKKCSFARQDLNVTYYDMKVSDLEGEYTHADFTVDTTKFDQTTKTIYFSVAPTDGNAHITKYVMIFVKKV